MIEAAEREGKLKPGRTIVEPTSGNTGLGLAIAASSSGYKLVCTASDKISKEKIGAARGARRAGHHLPDRRRGRRSALVLQGRRADPRRGGRLPALPVLQPGEPGGALPHAPAPRSGARPTARSPTGWPASAPAARSAASRRYLKEQNPAIRVIGVDPVGSVYAYYKSTASCRRPRSSSIYLIDGIGQSFMPDRCWPDTIDEVITVDDQTAYRRGLRARARGGDLHRLVGRRGGVWRRARWRAGFPPTPSSSRSSPTPASATSRSSTPIGWVHAG